MLGKHTPLDDVARGLRAACPELDRIEPLQLLGNGYRSMVVETPDGLVFRVAKHETAAQGYARERALLPLIRAALPVAVPDPQWQISPTDLLPFGAIGYPKLVGSPITPQTLDRDDRSQLVHNIAAFLVTLHGIAPATLTDQVPQVTLDLLAERRDEVLPVMHWALPRNEYRTISAWWEELLVDQAMRDYTPALHHGDLWYEHLLIAPETDTLVGVLDWEAAAIGDPARDLATQYHLGAPFAAQVMTAYHAAGGVVNASFQRRVQRWWQLRPFDGIHWAIQSDDAADLYESVRKLRNGPLLS